MYEEVWGCAGGDYYGEVGSVSVRLLLRIFKPSSIVVLHFDVDSFFPGERHDLMIDWR